MPNIMLTSRDTVLVRWVSLTPAEVERSVELAEATARKFGKVDFFAVVAPECALPNTESRTTLSNNMERMGAMCKTISVVIEGRGLKGATLRSVAASFLLFADKNKHVWGTLTEGVMAIRPNEAEELLKAAAAAGIS